MVFRGVLEALKGALTAVFGREIMVREPLGVSRGLGKLAPVGVIFAFQLGEKTLVTLLAL